MSDRSTVDRATPPHQLVNHTAPAGDTPALGDLFAQSMRERSRLMDQVDSFDTLGEYRKLDDVEQMLLRREAALRTGLAVQRQLLERARQALTELGPQQQSRHLAELQAAFLASMEGAVPYDADWGDLLRGATAYAAHRVRGDVRASIRAYRAMQQRYAWQRFRWVVWRCGLWIVGVAALVAALIAAPSRTVPIVLVAAVIVIAWLLARALLAGFVERGLVHQRRRYLRGWARDLTAAELRLQPEMILAVMALEHAPGAARPGKPADVETDIRQSPMSANGATEA
jgi:hypothetical protein